MFRFVKPFTNSSKSNNTCTTIWIAINTCAYAAECLNIFTNPLLSQRNNKHNNLKDNKQLIEYHVKLQGPKMICNTDSAVLAFHQWVQQCVSGKIATTTYVTTSNSKTNEWNKQYILPEAKNLATTWLLQHCNHPALCNTDEVMDRLRDELLHQLFKKEQHAHHKNNLYYCECELKRTNFHHHP